MSIIIMILLLSLLILVHEAGHFIAARAFGMKVEKFGFGLPIGPTLYRTKWKDVDILVHACLLGGYISFPDDDKSCELPKDSSSRFMNRPIYQRMVVISAGVLANIVVAFVIVLFTALMWKQLPSGEYTVTVSDIVAPKSEAIWDSGLKNGDKIYSVNGTVIKNTYSLLTIVKQSKKNDSLVSADLVDYNYNLLKALNPAFAKTELINQGVVVRLPKIKNEAPITLDKFMSKGAKLYKGNQYKISDETAVLRDMIKAPTYYVSDGTKSLFNIAEAISDNIHPINMVVERNGKKVIIEPLYPSESGALGIKLDSVQELKKTDTLGKALKAGAVYIYDNTHLMLYGLGQIVTGQIPFKDLHGIVAITKVGGDIIDNNGIFYGLLLAAMISIDLAIINFLPIPALDGGHFLFLVLEKIRKRPLNEEVIDKIANFCFFLLLALMIFVVCNDIFALITQKL